LAQQGVQNYHVADTTAGPFSGINVDSDGSFWIANQFADGEPLSGGGDWGSAIANFSVGPTPPMTRDDTASTFANVPAQIDILSNDSDPDDFIDPTTVAITHGPANGSVSLTGAFPGYVVYAPNSGFTGTDTFRYTVKDASGLTSNEATVTVTVRSDLPP